MDLFNAGMPFSYGALAIVFTLGISLTTLFFGVLVSVVLVTCIYCGVIRISPILDGIGNCINYFNPGLIESISQNIRSSLEIEYPEGTPEAKNIFIFHPHGVLSIANTFHVGTTLTDWATRPIKATMIDSIFWLPFAKELLEKLNVVGSKYESMKAVLDEGQSLTVCLGGVKEILYTEPHTMKLSIKNKRGVFKLALQTGTPLVPVISYGENELFEILDAPWLRPIQSMMIQYGLYLPIPTMKSCRSWFGIPWEPLKNPIRTVVGSPIKVTQVAEPSDKEIIDLRETYFKALTELYERSRPKNYKNLEIV